MKKPKLPNGMLIDFYYQQYADNSDLPDITLRNDNDCYDFPGYCSKQDIKKELSRLKRHAEALLKAHSYLQKVIKL